MPQGPRALMFVEANAISEADKLKLDEFGIFVVEHKPGACPTLFPLTCEEDYEEESEPEEEGYSGYYQDEDEPHRGFGRRDGDDLPHRPHERGYDE